jgi:glyoxylase-like metal-dependent hydrolase (beta-lactamase superfamily II)
LGHSGLMKFKELPVIKVIKVGTLCHEASEMASTFNLQIKSDLGIGGGSTVTLIEANKRILVDTGFDYEWMDTPENHKSNARSLRQALSNLRITPQDIDIVFITHWHRDHFGNLGIFKKAQLMASSLLVKRFGLENFIGLNDDRKIGEGVKVLLTPGHTFDHASILVNTVFNGVKARIAIAGDAVISHSYFQAGRIWKFNTDFYDSEALKNSALRIIGSSDIIIPGHGVPFMTYMPEWLKIYIGKKNHDCH